MGNKAKMPVMVCEIILKALACAVRQKKAMNGIRTKKEEMKVSLFADDIIGYNANPK